MEPDEGVVKFRATHATRALDARIHGELAARLGGWRTVLFGLGLIGQDAGRYGGVGYGNVSGRVGPFPGARGARAFLVSGTATGGLPCVDLEDLCLVRRYDIAGNTVLSEGPRVPSSESMTHGAVYDLAPHLRCVLHAHCPAVWRARAALGLPTTPPDVTYGTPQMARAVARLARESRLLERGLFAMAGHEDGVVAFGRSPDLAGAALVTAVARAAALAFETTGRSCG